MPFGWVDNQEWFSHAGVAIFFIHKDDDINQPTRGYLYGTSPYSQEDDNTVFDIRDLEGFDPGAPILRLSLQWGSRQAAAEDYDRMLIVHNITNGHIPENYMDGDKPDDGIGWVERKVMASAVRGRLVIRIGGGPSLWICRG